MDNYTDQIIVLPLKVLSRLLEGDENCVYNKEFQRRIISNDNSSVNYYVGDFSYDIIQYIQSHITHSNILTEYYQFLSSPINETSKLPIWYNVSLYEGRNGGSLHTYTSNICIRYFCKLVKTENERNNKLHSLQDDLHYETLISYGNDDEHDDEHDDEYLIKIEKLSAALSQLNERDLKVLDELVIKKQNWQVAFNELKIYLNPKPINGLTNKDDIINSWTNKQKQDAMSLLKGRAILKLKNAYFKQA